MNKAVKYTFATIFACFTIFYLAASLGLSAKKRAETGCERLKVVIADSTKNHFVTPDDVKGYIDKEAPGYIGKPVGEIDLVKIEQIIDSKSAVMKSEAFVTKDGTLNIRVTQREPMIRFQKADGGFYADCKGFLFPLQHNYTSHVPIVDGHIPLKAGAGFKGEVTDKAEKEWLDKMLALIRYIQDDKTLARNIIQMSIRENGDIILVPRTGKEKFIFGTPDRFEEKFRRMEHYYTAVVPEKGKDYYSTVNLKYDGQIVCRQ